MASQGPAIFVWYSSQHFHHSNLFAMTQFESLETVLEPVEHQEESIIEAIADGSDEPNEEEQEEEGSEEEQEEQA